MLRSHVLLYVIGVVASILWYWASMTSGTWVFYWFVLVVFLFFQLISNLAMFCTTMVNPLVIKFFHSIGLQKILHFQVIVQYWMLNKTADQLMTVESLLVWTMKRYIRWVLATASSQLLVFDNWHYMRTVKTKLNKYLTTFRRSSRNSIYTTFLKCAALTRQLE